MVLYAGIDYSMSTPAITVGPSSDFSKCKSFFYTKVKKFDGAFAHNIYGMMNMPYESEMERFNNLAEWAVAILKKFNVKEVCIEGYSMGSKGAVFNIGENTGILKYHLWKNGIKYYTVAPTQAKKHFTGKGNSNKEAMHDSFVERTGVSVAEVLNGKEKDSPVSDVVDSFAMLCFGIDNHFKE